MSRFSGTEIGDEKLGSIGAYWEHPLVSLEEALKPVMSRFVDLDRSIRLAKTKCHYPSEHRLTLDESAAIYLYTMEASNKSFYRVLNETLRSRDRRAARPWFGYLKLFDTAVDKLPTFEGNVWRGMEGDLSHQYTKGETLLWWSIISCSTAITVVQNFMGSGPNATLLLISAKNAKDIRGYTGHPNEEEVILKPDTYVRVKDNPLHRSGLFVVDVVELTHEEIRQEKEKSRSNLLSESDNKGATSTRQSETTSHIMPIQPKKPLNITPIQPSTTESTFDTPKKPHILLEN